MRLKFLFAVEGQQVFLSAVAFIKICKSDVLVDSVAVSKNSVEPNYLGAIEALDAPTEVALLCASPLVPTHSPKLIH